MTTLSDLAALAERRPQSLWCRLGFHRMQRVDWLITTGHSVCGKCGEVWANSLFGDFNLSRAESVALLRTKAAQGMEARQGGDDLSASSRSDDSPVGNADAPKDHPGTQEGESR